MSEKYNILLDSHVHYYKRFEINSFIKNTAANFNNFISRSGSAKYIGVLIITETGGEGGFSKLFGDLENSDLSNKMVRTNEDISFFLELENNLSLLFIKGQQIITKENLEVLALLNQSAIHNGLNLADTINEVENKSSVPVIAWGFGKWWGSRGKLLKEYLSNRKEKFVFIGDNGGRPRLLKLFPFVHNHKKMIILAGSDPLNITSGVTTPGSYGIILSKEIDQKYPAASLINSIKDLKNSPATFGKLTSLGSFLSNQILLRLNKVL